MIPAVFLRLELGLAHSVRVIILYNKSRETTFTRYFWNNREYSTLSSFIFYSSAVSIWTSVHLEHMFLWSVSRKGLKPVQIWAYLHISFVTYAKILYTIPPTTNCIRFQNSTWKIHCSSQEALFQCKPIGCSPNMNIQRCSRCFFWAYSLDPYTLNNLPLIKPSYHILVCLCSISRVYILKQKENRQSGEETAVTMIFTGLLLMGQSGFFSTLVDYSLPFHQRRIPYRILIFCLLWNMHIFQILIKNVLLPPILFTVVLLILTCLKGQLCQVQNISNTSGMLRKNSLSL